MLDSSPNKGMVGEEGVNQERMESQLDSSVNPDIGKKWKRVWRFLKKFLKAVFKFIHHAIKSSHSAREAFIALVANLIDEKLKTMDINDNVVVCLVTMVAEYVKKLMHDCNQKYRSSATSSSSQEHQEKGINYQPLKERYMEKLKMDGTFEDLTTRYMEKLKMDGNFEDLTPAQKNILTEEIYSDFCQGSNSPDEAYSASRQKVMVAELVLFAFGAAILVFDIISAPSPPNMVEIATKTAKFIATSSVLGAKN